MAKIIVFQHVPYEPLGTLDPLIRRTRHRIKYVNFSRGWASGFDLKRYHALIVLGGPMNVGEQSQYPHLSDEIAIIKKAIAVNMPVLGICLGAQLIAAALDAKVYPAESKEIGWYALKQQEAALTDPLFKHFSRQETIFQWHGWTFDLPIDAVHLIANENCPNQAFRYQDTIYGLQFHLEVDKALIERWVTLPEHLEELGLDHAPEKVRAIRAATKQHLTRSIALSHQVFNAFLSLLP